MKKYFKLLYSIIVFQLVGICSFAQESSHGMPLSLQLQLNESIPQLTLPYLDNKEESVKANAISSRSCNTCKNSYYGTGIDFPVDIKTAGHRFTVNNNLT